MADLVRRNLSERRFKAAVNNLFKLISAFYDKCDVFAQDVETVASLLRDIDKQLNTILGHTTPAHRGVIESHLYWIFQPLVKLQKTVTKTLESTSDFNLLIARVMVGDQKALATIFEQAASKMGKKSLWMYERISEVLYIVCLSERLKKEAGLPLKPSRESFKRAAEWLRTHSCGTLVGTSMLEYDGTALPSDRFVIFDR